MKLKLALFAIITSASCYAYAGRYEELQNKDSAWPINWNTQSGEIVYDSVCEDKGEGSVAYRNCRREAQKLFRDKCNSAKDKSSSKFCIAKNKYYP